MLLGELLEHSLIYHLSCPFVLVAASRSATRLLPGATVVSWSRLLVSSAGLVSVPAPTAPLVLAWTRAAGGVGRVGVGLVSVLEGWRCFGRSAVIRRRGCALG